MSNLFEEFGFDFGSVINDAVEAEKAEEKAEKKAPEKKAEKKAPSKAKKSVAKDVEAEEKISYPVTVKMPYKTLVLEGSGETTVKAVLAELFKQGYKEIALFNKIVNEGILYIGAGVMTSPADRKSAVSLKNPVTICIGELRCEYNSTHFNGEEEIALEEVVEKFTAENPRFSGAEWLFDPEVAVITPIFKGFPDKTTEKDAVAQGMESLSVFGVKAKLSAESETEIKNLPEEIGDGYTYLFGQIDKVLFATIKLPGKASSVTVRDEWKVNKDAKREKIKEKFALPLKLWLYNFNQERELTAADFGGKEKVTEDEVKKYLKDDISAFADDNRSFDFIYSKSQNTLSVGINSGKKGCVVSAGLSVMDDMWEDEEFVKDDEDDTYPVYKVCPMCGKQHKLNLTCSEYLDFDFKYPHRIPIQEIFPNMSKMEREFLQTGYCPKCQELLFSAEIPEGIRISEV